MNDCSLIFAITGIACGLINCCSDDELSIISAAATQLGDTLDTYLTQKEVCEGRQRTP